MDDWKRENVERARRAHLRKLTDAAENRMRQRTAKEQLAEAIAKGRGGDEIPDADDSSAWKGKE